MSKVLYTIVTNGHIVPTIEEWEVVKETEKQYKVRHLCIFTINKKDMGLFEDYKCVRKFYETKNEASVGLSDLCNSMIAQKEKEIEEAQNFIKKCKETIKELWK